jgi:ABC-type multidrug transport system ATPase subunit
LARAVVRSGRSRVLVLDEATAAVDVETDAMVQRIVRERFAGQTVVAVAHRLEGIMDFDRVAVVEGGRVVEWGVPEELVRDGGSAFGRLWRDLKGLRAEVEVEVEVGDESEESRSGTMVEEEEQDGVEGRNGERDGEL